MRERTSRLLAASALLVVLHWTTLAQITGSIAGTVVDSNGAAVPNATVVVTSDSGQEFTVVTNDNGSYRLPALGSGVYTLIVTSSGFKRSLVEKVKVDVGTPTTVNVSLQAGDVSESVTVTGSGGEVLQTQTATVGTTITGRQISETPIASRDALDLVGLLPGTSSVGAPRRSSINGLPKGALSITIDGVDVQDNLLRSSDGYFTYVRPRLDAIEEVTVSTANPGSEAGGDGAVQIKFVTKRGNNDFRGSAFWQHRDEGLNSNYWYLNANPSLGRNEDGTAIRQKIRLNQFGASLGGPLPYPGIGDWGGPYFRLAKDKAFFFINYEQFRLPETQNKQRTILTPDAQAGTFKYIVGTETRQANLYTIASNAGQLATPDPTVASILQQIRAATGTAGTITNITNASGVITDPNRQFYNFGAVGNGVRKFLALRFDANITKNHSLEFVVNRQLFQPSKDFLNSQEERFPGFPWYTQGSQRHSYATAVRSVLTKNIVNEARHTISTGKSAFSEGISAADFAYSRGFQIGVDAAGITSPYSRNSYSDRNSPTYDFTDSVTWLFGKHSINFGGQYKRIKLLQGSQGRIVPTISFGLDATNDATLVNMFSTATLPGASSTQLTEARNLYATLIGHITGYTSTAYLTDDGSYKENAFRNQNARQDTYGLFAQDQWKIKPNFSVNFGVRWQPQGPYVVLTENYAKLAAFEDVYGLSGLGNIFKPGTLTGRVPTVLGMKAGEEAFDADLNNFAPSVGFVWSPEFESRGFMRTLFGAPGTSVFRGGYSTAFVREGTALLGSLLSANPGGTVSASRSYSIGNITPSNLRDPNNPNLTAPAFITSPAYPLTLTISNSANAFDPNLKTGTVDSFSFGYQREINKDTVVELRYVGNRGKNLWRQHNINELNTVENGFAAEFLLAQQNLYANIAAGRCFNNVTPTAANPCHFNFGYFGPGTGTSPLPKILGYINTAATYDPSNPARYNNTLFTNSTLLANLSRLSPAVLTFANNIENSATRRANALANGLPSNFFYVNPTTGPSGSFILDNSAESWYDSGVLEVKRRLSHGLRFQASYVWSKARSDEFQSNSDNFVQYVHRDFGRALSRNVAVFDIRHAFKFDATYDLPIGRGRDYFSSMGWLANAFVGGWTILPTVRWQSGSPISFGNVSLVGMTKKEFQKEIKVRKGPSAVTFLPDDIILNTQKAFAIGIFNTPSPVTPNGFAANGGYATTFGTGGPSGRFLAPAGWNNCQSSYSGQCGFNNLIMYGPHYFKLDATIVKKIMIGEKRSVEFRATFLDALNAPNFRIGGWGADVVTSGVGGTTFGQLATGSAYQDVSTTNDNGGRQIDLMLRINF